MPSLRWGWRRCKRTPSRVRRCSTNWRRSVGAGAADTPIVRLVNPMGEWEGLRPTLRGSLLALAAENLKFVSGVAIGEVANVYLPRSLDELPDERLTLCIVLAGEQGERGYASTARPYDFWDAKGIVEAIMPAVGMTGLQFAATADPVFQPGRVAEVTANGVRLGVCGEVHPRVAAAFELPGRAFLVEFDLEPVIAAIAARQGTLRQLPPVSRYPAVEQDLAVIVDEAIPAADVEAVVRSAAGQLARRVRLFDVYRGEQVPVGKEKPRIRGHIAGTKPRTLRGRGDKGAGPHRRCTEQAIEGRIACIALGALSYSLS